MSGFVRKRDCFRFLDDIRAGIGRDAATGECYAATKAGASTPMGAQAEALYAMFDGLGYGGKDFSAFIQMLRGKIAELA